MLQCLNIVVTQETFLDNGEMKAEMIYPGLALHFKEAVDYLENM